MTEETKSVDLSDTVFIRDIESRVFQTICIKCLSQIEGVAFLGGNIFDHLLGREGYDRIKGVHVEQDQNDHSVSVKVEVNVDFGISIPEKGDEIQQKVAEEITRLTGLHVSCVHVVFKGIIPEMLPEGEEEVDSLEGWGMDEEELATAFAEEEQ